MTDNINMENDLKKFLGLPPYDNYTNLCYQDGIFYQSLIIKYGNQSIEKN